MLYHIEIKKLDILPILHILNDSNSVSFLTIIRIKIDEKSIFEIDTLATFIVSDSSLLHITGGSSLSLKKVEILKYMEQVQ